MAHYGFQRPRDGDENMAHCSLSDWNAYRCPMAEKRITMALMPTSSSSAVKEGNRPD